MTTTIDDLVPEQHWQVIQPLLPAPAPRCGICPRIARRGIEPRDKLGRHRYVVERSLAWLVGCRRLQVRYERRADILLGFLHLACALICLKAQSPSEA
jgi:transposase